MSIQIQLRRGTALQHDTFTGALAELTVDTTTKTLRLHDGTTVGGIKLHTPTGLSFNSETGQLTLATATNTNFTAILGLGTSDTPTFAGLTTTGDITIGGNLTVNGTTTTLSTTNLVIEDKNIILADGATTDAAANAGGITLKGATDKTLTWVASTERWTSNQNFEAPGFTTGTGVVINQFSSDGTLSGNSTTTVPTENAVKTYVDGRKDVTETLTGKTINLFSNTLTGTLAEFNTALSDANFASLAGTETLTNKTLGATTIAGNLIPDVTETYDLGSATNRFRDLYLKGASIYLADAKLSFHTGKLRMNTNSVGNYPVGEDTEMPTMTAVQDKIKTSTPSVAIPYVIALGGI